MISSEAHEIFICVYKEKKGKWKADSVRKSAVTVRKTYETDRWTDVSRNNVVNVNKFNQFWFCKKHYWQQQQGIICT